MAGAWLCTKACVPASPVPRKNFIFEELLKRKTVAKVYVVHKA